MKEVFGDQEALHLEYLEARAVQAQLVAASADSAEINRAGKATDAARERWHRATQTQRHKMNRLP